MLPKHKVYLMGGEGTGWALDADILTTRESLTALGNLVEFTSLEEADVVHSVWEWPLLRMPKEKLFGKKILCHVCNDLMRTYEQSCMVNANRIGLWVPISRQTERELNALNLQNVYVPYAVDTKVFTETVMQGLTVKLLREKYNIPENCFIISNFMRDSLGTNLSVPKEQKGVEVFFEIVKQLHHKDLSVHVLLAGPRRHFIKSRLQEYKIPFTYVGSEIDGDDNEINILDAPTINLLYHVSDLHLVTSRWEGGPRAVLEAAATMTCIVCPEVGLAPDVLDSDSLFHSVTDGIEIIKRHIDEKHLNNTTKRQFDKVMKNHLPASNVDRFKHIYKNLDSIPIYNPKPNQPEKKEHSRLSKRYYGWLRGYRPAAGLHISLWHEFHKPPYGGGNQFMMALKKELLALGAKVSVNRMSKNVDAHICNSAWFDKKAFTANEYQSKPKMIHRIDGPIALYRGSDWLEDERVSQLNSDFATATVFQSPWSYENMVKNGMSFVRPVIIGNAVDDSVFYPHSVRKPTDGRRLKIISTAWSDNPNKGGRVYKWLDDNLNFDRYEYTFVGRINEELKNIRHVPPQNSKKLGSLLRDNDIYLTASRNDPCSNALLEALACGLPAIYYQTGGHGHLVGFGGLPFTDKEDILEKIDKMSRQIDAFRNAICVPNIREIAMRYVELVFEIV